MVNYFPSVNHVVLSKLILSLLMVLIGFLIVLYSDRKNQKLQTEEVLQGRGPQTSEGT